MEADRKKNYEAFFLLLKRKKITIKPQSTEQIPFGFRPREINEYECVITIQMSEDLTWRFPIKGVTESDAQGINFSYKVKTRERFQDQMNIVLPGLIDIDPNEEF